MQASQGFRIVVQGIGRGVVFAASVLVAGCAALPVIAPPEVQLEAVELDELGLYGQTFLLGFSVHNPNPFPLPVKSVRYEVRLEDERFAGGETRTGFVVAPEADSEFAISVEIDLLQSAAGFNTLIESGFQRTMRYELKGSLELDIPSAKPVAFTRAGSVRLGTAAR